LIGEVCMEVERLKSCVSFESANITCRNLLFLLVTLCQECSVIQRYSPISQKAKKLIWSGIERKTEVEISVSKG
jgi:hypothetical protein